MGFWPAALLPALVTKDSPLSEAVAIQRTAEPAPTELLFGDAPGCWNIDSRYQELLDRVRGVDREHGRYEEARDFVHHVLLLVAERIESGLIRPSSDRGSYGFYRESASDPWQPIHDPIDHLARLVRERGNTILSGIRRDHARKAPLPDLGLPDRIDRNPEDTRESVNIVREFHSMPINNDCAEIYRLHDEEGMIFRRILLVLGPSLGLRTVSSIRGRYYDCRHRLSLFVMERYKGEAKHWSGS